MEELLKRDLSLGGEQSGHVIFTEHLFTGDGLVTALERAARHARDGTSAWRARVRPDHLPAGAGERARAAEDRSAARCRKSPAVIDASSRSSRVMDGCSCGTRAPSRCSASCSRAATRPRFARGLARSRRPSARTSPDTRHGPAQRQRQQGRDAAQLAGRARARPSRGRARVRGGWRAGDHGAPAGGRPPHHARRRSRRGGGARAARGSSRVQHRGRPAGRPA